MSKNKFTSLSNILYGRLEMHFQVLYAARWATTTTIIGFKGGFRPSENPFQNLLLLRRRLLQPSLQCGAEK